MHDLALDRRHRLELDPRSPEATARSALRTASASSVARAALAIARRVDDDLLPRPRRDVARVIAFARYCTASIVWPWRPISMPEVARPSTTAVIRVVVLVHVDAARRRRLPSTIRSTSSRRCCGELGLVDRLGLASAPRRRRDGRDHPRRRVADAEQPALALRTAPGSAPPTLSSPGCGCSSSRSAAHFASPTVSPVGLDACSSSLIGDRRLLAPHLHAARLRPGRAALRRRQPGRVLRGCAPASRCSAFAGVRDERFAGGGAGRRDQPARDQALPDRPEVRRHPVEDEAGREVREDEGMKTSGRTIIRSRCDLAASSPT